jgi:hypothetical protein
MENIELQYSNNGSLMQGIYNGDYLDSNEISKVVFDALEGENLPPEASSPELLGNILQNFSEGWLKPIQSILGSKGINFTVKGDSYQYNLRESKMTNETLRMQVLAGIITESEYKAKLEETKKPKSKKQLDENFVGIGAINNPFPVREKTDYQLAFDHYMGNINEVEGEEEMGEEEMGEENPIDAITMDVPLFIRMLEFAREDASTDMDLHDLAEKAIAMSAEGGMLSMDNYEDLVGAETSEEN